LVLATHSRYGNKYVVSMDEAPRIILSLLKSKASSLDYAAVMKLYIRSLISSYVFSYMLGHNITSQSICKHVTTQIYTIKAVLVVLEMHHHISVVPFELN
jgi:hypothetical protein